MLEARQRGGVGSRSWVSASAWRGSALDLGAVEAAGRELPVLDHEGAGGAAGVAVAARALVGEDGVALLACGEDDIALGAAEALGKAALRRGGHVGAPSQAERRRSRSQRSGPVVAVLGRTGVAAVGRTGERVEGSGAPRELPRVLRLGAEVGLGGGRGVGIEGDALSAVAVEVGRAVGGRRLLHPDVTEPL